MDDNIGQSCISIMQECYDALCDDLSRKLFFARIETDLSPSLKNIDNLAALSGYGKEQLASKLTWLPELVKAQVPIYLYGCGNFGTKWFEILASKNVNIKGFFDMKYKTVTSHMGLPVLAPPVYSTDWQNSIEDNAKILVTVALAEDEIREQLCEAGVPQERILPSITCYAINTEQEYFDFIERLPTGGAFIDGGCYDMWTSIRFTQLCPNQYSKIFAFEPDPKNYELCKKKVAMHGLESVQLIPAGLWSETTTLHFHAEGQATSSFCDEGEICVRVVTLDEIVRDERVSFIKMDIEGSEMGALQGACKTIQRDKPMCAICIYHKPGDVLAISHYLKQLVPEYQFAIRYHTFENADTILYAFV